MTTQHDTKNDDLTEQESDKLDADLLAIDLLYRSRCVQAPKGSNVVVREIEKKE